MLWLFDTFCQVGSNSCGMPMHKFDDLLCDWTSILLGTINPFDEIIHLLLQVNHIHYLGIIMRLLP